VCYLKRLEALEKEEQEESGKGKEAAEDSPIVRHVKERLADTHDALSEISLENERYAPTLTWIQPGSHANTTIAIPMLSKMAEHHSSTSLSCTLRSLRSSPKLTSSFPWLWNLLL
jgi:hypothetical protein